MEYANWFVVVMGVGIVFFGLVVLIVAVTIMGKILGHKVNAAGADVNKAPALGAAPGGAALPQAKLEPDVVAAIAAAIADDMGTDVSGIRINSIKQVA